MFEARLPQDAKDNANHSPGRHTWRAQFITASAGFGVFAALSIPITLAMTLGFAYMLGIDLQQVSIATLIIALGLLVDDPVVAGDAIKRSLVDKQPSIVAAWLGPTKLAKAIMFATITNIAAHLPFLMLTSNTAEFLYRLRKSADSRSPLSSRCCSPFSTLSLSWTLKWVNWSASTNEPQERPSDAESAKA